MCMWSYKCCAVQLVLHDVVCMFDCFSCSLFFFSCSRGKAFGLKYIIYVNIHNVKS